LDSLILQSIPQSGAPGGHSEQTKFVACPLRGTGGQSVCL